MTLFGLRANQETLPGGLFVITSRTSPAGAVDPFPARPLRSPRLCREPASPWRYAPPRALGAVCGARRKKQGQGDPEEETGETERKETENAVLAKTVLPGTFGLIETFKMQPEGGEEQSPFWVTAPP